LKLAFQAILEECNRIAIEADKNDRARFLKSKVVQLDLEFGSGAIDEDEYGKRQAEILEDLRNLSKGEPGEAPT
jgi:hypothetical protein